MIPIQILRVLSTIQQYDVLALLMGGQACVLYGAAEYSRDLDLAALATDTALSRFIAASYDSARDEDATTTQAKFWLSELRSPEFLREAISRFPIDAARSTRPAVAAALAGGDVDGALANAQANEMAADRAYWEPLRRELELAASRSSANLMTNIGPAS